MKYNYSHAIVYMAINKVNDFCYIGKTVQDIERRKIAHISKATNKKSNTYFHRSIYKYGKDSFDWIVLESVGITEVNDAEKFWISYFKSIGADLYNLTNGGDGGDHRTGKTNSVETRLKISQSQLGSKNHMYGKVYTDQERLNLSMKLKNNGAKTYKLLSPDNEIVIVYNLSDFCKKHNLCRPNIHKVLRGERLSVNGWKKYNEI